MTQDRLLSKLWIIYIPLIALAAQIALETSFSRQTLAAMHSESGPHELLQFLTIGLAFLVGLRTLIRFPFQAKPWLGAWFALATLCCLYIAGEEMSWGQQVLKWSTPEFWSQVNDQNETNLHNTSSWLDQKPRLILELGVMIGGIVIPLILKYKPGKLPTRFNALYPPYELMLISIIALVLKIIDTIGDELGHSPFARVSEVIELYMFYYVLLYLWALRRRESLT